MISRILLLLSCSLGALIACGFIASSVYGYVNPNLVSDMTKSIDLSATPQVNKIKNDVVKDFNKSGILQIIWNTLLIVGSIIFVVCSLGLLGAITVWKIVLALYIFGQGLMLILFAVVLFMLLDEDSLIGRKLVSEMADAQETKFVSVVALLEGKTSNGAFVTVFLNVLQVMLGCCGARYAGDIRNSSSWRASERGLAGLLKLGKNDSTTDMNFGDMSDASSMIGNFVPDWLRSRIPPGSTLPPGLNLPDKLPEGVVIPSDFNVTDLITLRNSTAIRMMFEKSLVLYTPISCCSFKNADAIFKFKPRDLVSSMTDPNCPFSPENGPGVYKETCYKKALRRLTGYSTAIAIFGIVIGLIMTCNLTLATQLIICG